MALINRMTRLFRADFNAVLDRMEEPEALLKDAIRDMELSIENDKQQLVLLEIEINENNSQRLMIDENSLKIQREIELCFETDNEALARKMVRKKLESNKFNQILKQRQQQLETGVQNIESRIVKNSETLSVITQKFDLLKADKTSRVKDHIHPDNNLFIDDDEVEIAFIKEKQQRTRS